MPAATVSFAMRADLTIAELDAVWDYIQRERDRTGFHMSLSMALETLLKAAIDRERGRSHESR